MRKKTTRAGDLGRSFADNVMEAAHLTYNAPRGRKIVETCIKRLQERIDEIQKTPASPAYKKARYGNKKKEKQT